MPGEKTGFLQTVSLAFSFSSFHYRPSTGSFTCQVFGSKISEKIKSPNASQLEAHYFKDVILYLVNPHKACTVSHCLTKTSGGIFSHQMSSV